jgi:predicted lipoprotein
MEKILAKSTWKYAHVSVMPVITGSHRHWSFRTVATIALFFLMQLSLTACKLWTIRPIESKEQKPAAAAREFNADAYVDSIWESKVVPLVAEKAVVLPVLLNALDADVEAAKKQYGSGDAGGAAHFIVKGEGRVSRVNASSQNGAIVISLPGYKGKTEVVLQIGPVFRGTAIRDAVGFIEFNQFVNQLQFADVGNKLNDRVFTSVVNDFDLATAQGKQVSFYGAFTLGERGKIIITPVKLEAGGNR